MDGFILGLWGYTALVMMIFTSPYRLGEYHHDACSIFSYNPQCYPILYNYLITLLLLFQILQFKDYELRKYPSALWVSTDIYDIDMKDAGSEAFHRLFDYISGDNVDGKIIYFNDYLFHLCTMGEQCCALNGFPRFVNKNKWINK